MPITFYVVIAGTNSILTSFYRAIGNETGTTLAGHVLASSTYDANRYRAYANANKRLPITISVYSTENSFGAPLSDEDLKKAYSDDETQEILGAIAGAFVNDGFLPFEKSTVYSNGFWENYKELTITHKNKEYSGLSQYFENFVCTQEQYYIMADFVDYCELHNLNFYVKAISESDICWKYVDDAVLTGSIDDEGNRTGDITLNISYRDAHQINNPTTYASAADDGKQKHKLSITTKVDVTSPVSDSLKTVSTLLGMDENSATFNAMERDDSGDFSNFDQYFLFASFVT